MSGNGSLFLFGQGNPFNAGGAGYTLFLRKHASNGTYRLDFIAEDDSNYDFGVYSDFNLDYGDNQWHQVTVTIDRNGTAILYMDGVSKGTASATSLGTVSYNRSFPKAYIGDNVKGTTPSGNQLIIDEVRIYHEALSPDYVTILNQTARPWERQVEYTYDVFDRRIGKDIDEEGDGVWNDRERYIYDGSDIVAQYNTDTSTGAFNLTHRYLHGPAVDQILADEQYDI